MMALLAGLGATQAQTTVAGGGAAPPLSATEQWIQDAKKPANWLSWGADLRLRNEYFNNSQSLGDAYPLHEQDYFRFRGRIYTSITPVAPLSLNARLSAEPREWMRPSSAGAYRGREGMEWRYGILDNLNIEWREIANAPVTFKVGRQDIQMGDTLNWWLMADGTPGDGSWTFFLDSARATIDLKDSKTKIDLMGIYQNAFPGDGMPGEWLPTLGNSDGYSLTEQREVGGVVYVSNRSIQKAGIDAYFIYKGDTAESLYGYDSDTYTLGAKLGGDLDEHWRYSAEGAYQFGNRQLVGGSDNTINAWGVNARLAYQFKDDLKNVVKLNCEYLSGDNPGSGQNEGFDLLWGRWPRWSELYIYSYIPESGRVAQIGNLIRVGPAWSITPAKGLDFGLEYNALFSDEQFALPDGPPPPGTGRFGSGTFRGHYVQAVLKYRVSQHMSAHLWSEFVWMGDFYAQRDLMSFLRAELLFTF